MLDRAFKLSSNWSLFHEECIRLKTLFLQLSYPEHLIHSTFSNFITSKQTPAPPRKSAPDLQSVRIVLPFKEQKSANSVRKQLKDLGKLLNIDLSPVFVSRKVGEDLKHKEIKPALINKQSVVYKCWLCWLCWLHASASLPAMSIKDLDQYSITAKVGIHLEQRHLL